MKKKPKNKDSKMKLTLDYYHFKSASYFVKLYISQYQIYAIIIYAKYI